MVYLEKKSAQRKFKVTHVTLTALACILCFLEWEGVGLTQAGM